MVSCLASAAALGLVLSGGHAQAPNAVTQAFTTTVTVDRIDRATRLVVFHGPDGVPQSVVVDRAVAAFDDLKTGDHVTIRYIESVIVQVRPGASPRGVRDSTAEARKAGEEGVEQQLSMVVTVESVDLEHLMVTYKTYDNRRVMRAVRDKRLLEGVKAGDRVEITQTRARAISISPGSR